MPEHKNRQGGYCKHCGATYKKRGWRKYPDLCKSCAIREDKRIRNGKPDV